MQKLKLQTVPSADRFGRLPNTGACWLESKMGSYVDGEVPRVRRDLGRGAVAEHRELAEAADILEPGHPAMDKPHLPLWECTGFAANTNNHTPTATACSRTGQIGGSVPGMSEDKREKRAERTFLRSI